MIRLKSKIAERDFSARYGGPTLKRLGLSPLVGENLALVLTDIRVSSTTRFIYGLINRSVCQWGWGYNFSFDK